MNMKKVKLADLFEQYGAHYIATYHASIEKGIIFEIEKKLGRSQQDNPNSFLYLSEAISLFKSKLQEDYNNLVDYHNEELIQLSKNHFLSNLIKKDKKEKIRHHQLRLEELHNVYMKSDKNRCITDDTIMFNMHQTDIKDRAYLHVVDLTNQEQMSIERIYINNLIPFIDSENNISLRLNVVAFNVTQIEVINPEFIDNHLEPLEGYHIFNCREKAYDFAIEELMKSQYNENIKMRLKLAKQVDSLFGQSTVY
jgi:hypothetical protein